MIARVPDRSSPRAPRPDHREVFRYLLALDAFPGAHVFVTRDAVALASAQILRVAAERRFEILTYCFMLDHARLLVEALDRDGDAEGFAARVGQCPAPRGARPGALWRRAAVECVRDNDALAVSRHIFESPVRAGLVTRACDYPFSGSFAWDKLACLAVSAA